MAQNSVEHIIFEPLVRNKIYFNFAISQLCNICFEILITCISNMSFRRFVLVTGA
jgi:hypothetical protein